MTPPDSSRPWALLALALVVFLPRPASAQSAATLRVEENFRRVPNGEVLARMEAGAPVTVVDREGGWREVLVEGWVWTRSLQITDEDGLDLVVSAEGGENLRAEPSGEILGRLGEGTLLEELERRPGWIRARRQGWIWGASLDESAGAATPSPTGAAPAGASSAGADPPSRRPTGVTRAGAGGTAILGAPDGDTLATAAGGTELEVVARQGRWARVRLEGWTWLPEEAVAEAGTEESGAPLTPTDLVADPQAHRGRVVTWSVQFISLEEAERVRTDFFEGEPFLLTRYGGPDGPFVYVAVPQDRLSLVQGLTPLERLSVTGRVRTGASALTGTPILDLMSLSRGGEDR